MGDYINQIFDKLQFQKQSFDLKFLLTAKRWNKLSILETGEIVSNEIYVFEGVNLNNVLNKAKEFTIYKEGKINRHKWFYQSSTKILELDDVGYDVAIVLLDSSIELLFLTQLGTNEVLLLCKENLHGKNIFDLRVNQLKSDHTQNSYTPNISKPVTKTNRIETPIHLIDNYTKYLGYLDYMNNLNKIIELEQKNEGRLDQLTSKKSFEKRKKELERDFLAKVSILDKKLEEFYLHKICNVSGTKNIEKYRELQELLEQGLIDQFKYDQEILKIQKREVYKWEKALEMTRDKLNQTKSGYSIRKGDYKVVSWLSSNLFVVEILSANRKEIWKIFDFKHIPIKKERWARSVNSEKYEWKNLFIIVFSVLLIYALLFLVKKFLL